MNKSELKLRIFEIDFAIHELTLYLDSHPTCQKAMELLREFREKREQAISAYEKRFGPYAVTSCGMPADGCWKWLDGPWPWENDFMEA